MNNNDITKRVEQEETFAQAEFVAEMREQHDLASLKLPFWVARNKGVRSPSHVSAFASRDSLEQFMREHNTIVWHVHYVENQQDLKFLVTDLYREGANGICFDGDNVDGCTKRFSIVEMLAEIAD